MVEVDSPRSRDSLTTANCLASTRCAIRHGPRSCALVMSKSSQTMRMVFCARVRGILGRGAGAGGPYSSGAGLGGLCGGRLPNKDRPRSCSQETGALFWRPFLAGLAR